MNAATEWLVSLIAQVAPAPLPAPDNMTAFVPLVGQLGAAGAVVIVVVAALMVVPRLFTQFREYHAESQSKFQAQIDRLDKAQDERDHRSEDRQRALLEHMSRANDKMTDLMRDVIITTKAVEQTVAQHGTQFRTLEKAVDSLQSAVGTLDTLVKQSIGFYPPTAVRGVVPQVITEIKVDDPNRK